VPEIVTQPHEETSEAGGQPLGSGMTKEAIMPDIQQIITAATIGIPRTSGRVSELPGMAGDPSSVEEPPDVDNMHEAECILRQPNKRNGTREFLVRWVDRDATDSWTNEDSLRDDLLLHWGNTHTRKGALRKNLSFSLIGTPRLWAHKRGWSSDSTEHNEEVDQYGNEI